MSWKESIIAPKLTAFTTTSPSAPIEPRSDDATKGESVLIYGISIDPQSADKTITFTDNDGNTVLIIVSNQAIDMKIKFLARNGFIVPAAASTVYVYHSSGGA
jgi:hypothetical protein